MVKKSEESVANVKVLVRVRPQVTRENESEILVSMPNKTTTILNSNKQKDTKTFQFDQSLWSCNDSDSNYKSQLDTYNAIGREILEHTISGYNTCIFTYGQTGSGKTYTMMGNEEEIGIIPRVCKELFNDVESFSKLIKTNIKISYFEIYNEQVNDLLEESNVNKKLKIRENPKTGPYVESLNEFDVSNYKEILQYMKKGNLKRTTATTIKNDQSSRSHAIFTINIRITEFNEDLEIIKERNSSLKLVDLAGSERSLGSQGLRLKEGNNINKSLTTLGRVISSLSCKDGTIPPFRDSILTWLLKENLNGNCKTVMIGCISPCDYEETLSTLRYATLVKKVELKAIRNIDEINSKINEEKFKEMEYEINELNKKLLDKENEEDINRLDNINRYYNNKLIDERNKSNILKYELNIISNENFNNKKKINLLIDDISFDKWTVDSIKDIQSRHNSLINSAKVSNELFLKELIQFN